MTTPTQSLTWESTKAELNLCRLPSGEIDYDRFRKERLEAIQQHTGIPIVVYATDFLNAQKVRHSQGQVDIDLTDLQGFAEVTKDLPDGPLDVLLHSPGGSAEAAESIVQVIRQRFNPVRFIIPVVAKSAATMIALSGNSILMPSSAELGPIDPQFRLPDGAGGVVMTPAQVLIDQFNQAQAEITKNPNVAPVWAPILHRYGVGLLQMSVNAIELSKRLVRQWLIEHMFHGKNDAAALADGVVDYLADHNAFLTHGRRVGISDLHAHKVTVVDLPKADPALWHLVEASWYAIQHTFEGTGAFKLFENSRRKTFVRAIQVLIQVGAPVSVPGRPPQRSWNPDASSFRAEER